MLAMFFSKTSFKIKEGFCFLYCFGIIIPTEGVIRTRTLDTADVDKIATTSRHSGFGT